MSVGEGAMQAGERFYRGPWGGATAVVVVVSGAQGSDFSSRVAAGGM